MMHRREEQGKKKYNFLPLHFEIEMRTGRRLQRQHSIRRRNGSMRVGELEYASERAR